MKYIEEELTLAEFADRFLNLNDFKTPSMVDMSDFNIEVESYNKETHEKEYRKIKSFIVKNGVKSHYTDDKIKVAPKHKFIENDTEIFAEDHLEFKKIELPLDIVDIEVEHNKNYFANGRLNHNTTSGGKALDFHSSVKIRLNIMSKIKQKIHGIDEVIGVKLKAKITKNRVGPPHRESNFELYFDSGISKYSSWMKTMKEYNIVKSSGAWSKYKLITENGEEEELKFQAKELPLLLDTRPELKKSMYDKISEKRIMLYKNQDEVIRVIGEDDIQLENGDMN